MAGVEVEHQGTNEGDPRLDLITVVFRPFLEKNLDLKRNRGFLVNLTGASSLDAGILGLETTPQLLDHLAAKNKKGTYAAFIGSLRSMGEETESFKYLADFIEGMQSAVEEYECRENIKHWLQAFCVRLCGVDPTVIIVHLLEDISQEEAENVRQATANHGDTCGALLLLQILFTKGLNCIRRLIIGLRAAGKGKLADEMSDMISGADDDCSGKMSSKLSDASDIDTCTMVDEPVAYKENTLSDDCASGCDDSLMSAGKLEETAGGASSLTSDSSLKSNDVNFNTSEEEKNLSSSAKDVSPKRENISHQPETQHDDRNGPTQQAMENDTTQQGNRNDTNVNDMPQQGSGTDTAQQDNRNGTAQQDDGNDNVQQDDGNDSPEESPPEIIPIELRNYQKELITAALHGKNSVIVAPTGSGKTVIAARLTKAVLDREPNVGPRSGNSNPPTLVENGSNKVIFIVNKVPLVKQQCDLFKKYIDCSRIMGLSGEVGHIGSLVDLFEKKDVLVMTAQILVNALQGSKEDNDRMELSKIGLLILDECHHCQKGDPYNEIMAEYCSLKLLSPNKERPQVLGLTASMGVGKAKTRYKAQTHILTLCANLDAEKLCTVQDPANLEELKRKRDKPTEVILPVRGRKNDRFRKVIEPIMAKIEDLITETPGGEIIRKECHDLKCPPNRGTQVYEQWLVRMHDYIAGEVDNDDTRMRLVTCVDHLKEYNNSLYINRDARIQDALDYLQRFLKRHEEQDTASNSFENMIVDLFKEKEELLQDMKGDPANKNPMLDCLSRTLIEALAMQEHSRGILFCKTRAATEALLAWIEETPQLKFLKPGRLIGCGGTGMTQKQQTELLSLFRDGGHQLIVATSVAEEGLDIQQCNVVIRYNYISNDIGRVQAQGRNRAKDGKFYLIVSEELKLHEREFMNQIREKMMLEATQNLQKMTEEDFLTQIARIQKDSKLERKLKKFNRSLLKCNKKLVGVHLICRKCGTKACTADDIKCIQNAHHIVLDDSFTERCEFIDIPSRSVCADMELRKRIICGNKAKACTQEWGNQMLYKGCLVNLLSPKYFVMKMPKGPSRTFKKWKDAPFKIAALSLEELDKICNMSEDDDEEDEEAEGQEQDEDERVNGDGMETVTAATSNQPHRERATLHVE